MLRHRLSGRVSETGDAALRRSRVDTSGVRPLFLLVALGLGFGLGCGGGNEQRTASPLAPGATESAGTPSAPEAADSDAVPAVPDAAGNLLVDELDDADALFAAGAIHGEWFTYSDGTSAITPPDHTGIGAVDGEAHITGQGFSDWGAGVSAYFTTVDLSAFDHFTLRARGTGTLVVELATPATSPPAEGGTCEGEGCFGHFATTVRLGADYQDFVIAFDALTQPSWAQPATLSVDRAISLNVVAKVSGTAPASIDLWVDRLTLHTR